MLHLVLWFIYIYICVFFFFLFCTGFTKLSWTIGTRILFATLSFSFFFLSFLFSTYLKILRSSCKDVSKTVLHLPSIVFQIWILSLVSIYILKFSQCNWMKTSLKEFHFDSKIRIFDYISLDFTVKFLWGKIQLTVFPDIQRKALIKSSWMHLIFVL